MADIPRLVRFVALTAAVVWFGLTVRAQAAQPAEPAGAAETESTARIVDAPANIRSFAPEESAVTVNAAEVNLRQVFEDLGPDATLWYQHVQTLANSFFEGRAPASRGIELAAEYIEFFFRRYGLEPAFPAETEPPGADINAGLTSYRQPFSFTVRSPRGKGEAAVAQHPVAGERPVDGEDSPAQRSGTGPTFYADNVGGILPGRGELADEWIVIGAHYDHVGYGSFGTLPANRGKLHPGADDNASGTAGVLILARQLADAYADEEDDHHLRSILFLAFSAEESGLHGSRYFVNHSTIRPQAITAMVNLDMIGRLRSGRLSVSGIGTAEEFEALLRPHFEQSDLTVATSEGGLGPSDHLNFFEAGIPVLFMFTGIHPEYTSPRDLAYTVNPAGAVKILNLVSSIVLDLAARSERLTFVHNTQGAVGPRMGAKVRLGIMPNYGADVESGVVVDVVFDGTSADEAGILPGDIILHWNGLEVTDGAKLMELFRAHQPGDVVTIILQRGEAQVELQVTLHARSATDQ